MNNYIVSLMVALAAIVTVSAAPSVVINGDSSGVSTNKSASISRHIGLMSEPLPQGAVEVYGIWVAGPPKGHPDYPAFAQKVQDDLIAGRTPESAIDILQPVNLVQSLNKVPWRVWVLKAKAGYTTSLADAVTAVTCLEDPNLNEVRRFDAENQAYGPYAIGFKNGERVVSGPSTIRVEFLMFMVATKTYSDPLDVITRWVDIDNGGVFSLKMAITAPGAGTVYTTLSTQGYNALPPSSFIITKVAGGVNLSLDGYEGRSYRLFSRSDLKSGSWGVLGSVSGKETFFVPTTLGQEYYTWEAIP